MFFYSVEQFPMGVIFLYIFILLCIYSVAYWIHKKHLLDFDILLLILILTLYCMIPVGLNHFFVYAILKYFF